MPWVQRSSRVLSWKQNTDVGKCLKVLEFCWATWPSWGDWDSPDHWSRYTRGHSSAPMRLCLTLMLQDIHSQWLSVISPVRRWSWINPLQTSHQWFSVTLQLNYSCYCSVCSWSSFFWSHSCCSFFHHALLGFYCHSFTLSDQFFFYSVSYSPSLSLWRTIYSPPVVWLIV